MDERDIYRTMQRELQRQLHPHTYYPNADLTAQPRREQQPAYSLCQVVYTDGTTFEMTIKATPAINNHLMEKMKDTGFLSIFNDTDSVMIRADLIKSISLRKITAD